MKSYLCSSIALSLSFLLCSCAHTPLKSGEEAELRKTLSEICAYGNDIQSVKGSVWMKARAKEASGQFPAFLKITPAGEFDMEVTNLIGATVAQIRIRGNQYEVTMPGKNARREEGESHWAGIPLEWARSLFLGRFPCPSGDSARWKLRATDLMRLEVEIPKENYSERFAYELTSRFGRAWPKTLRWSRQGSGQTAVDFEFQEAEEDTGSPLVWKARSNRGEVAVRWQKRNRGNP